MEDSPLILVHSSHDSHSSNTVLLSYDPKLDFDEYVPIHTDSSPFARALSLSQKQIVEQQQFVSRTDTRPNLFYNVLDPRNPSINRFN